MKKTIALLLAGVMSTASLTVAMAQDPLIAKNLAVNSEMFKQKMSITSTFLDMVKAIPGEVVTFDAEKYAFTVKADEIGELPTRYRTYNLKTERITENLGDYDRAVGEKTPKYVLKMESDEAFPAPILLTVKKSSFMPGSTLHVYRFEKQTQELNKFTNVFTPIASNLTVNDNGDFSFTVTQGGKYLISALPIEDHTDYPSAGYDFDRPVRVDPNELLSYLEENPDGYFTAALE